VLLGLKAVEEARSDEERTRPRVRARAGRRDAARRPPARGRAAPKALDDFGLVAALERLRETFSEQTGMRVELEARIGDRLPSDVETALYRIVQEALTNIVKHAQASSVSIVLAAHLARVTAVIEDDGRGFVPARHRGLGPARHGRAARALGGKLKLESSPDSGTTIVAEVPLR
jgi:signal transduction histidine kinase